MAYESTAVPVAKSQESIRKLIMQNGGNAIAFVSQVQPATEGFEAQVKIGGVIYRVRVTASVKTARTPKEAEQNVRRIWRVLFYHMKSVYESSKSGVMEFRELMLPYIVMSDGQTIGDHIVPRLEQVVSGKPERLLGPAPEPKQG